MSLTTEPDISGPDPMGVGVTFALCCIDNQDIVPIVPYPTSKIKGCTLLARSGGARPGWDVRCGYHAESVLIFSRC